MCNAVGLAVLKGYPWMFPFFFSPLTCALGDGTVEV